MNEKRPKCIAGEREKCLCAVVTEMVRLYSAAEEDRPDSLLGIHPGREPVVEALQILVDAMFPGKMSEGTIQPDEMDVYLTQQLSHAWRRLRPEIEKAIPFRWLGEAAKKAPPVPVDAREESFEIMTRFMERLPDVRRLLIEDVTAAYEGDPAALTYAEVQLAYPGLLAITSHRIAHEFYNLDIPIVPRIMSEWTHSKTGVDIHPGATIGHGFFIDHATGVVIGETTRIGNGVKIYQGVTLGAKSFPLDEQGHPVKHIQRHPKVEDNVVIYGNATILGGDVVIGKGSTVGGNVFLTESVPPNSFVLNEHPRLQIKTSEKQG